MSDFLQFIQEAKIPTILIIAGILFLFLAIGGDFGAKILTTKLKRKLAGLFGAIFLILGLLSSIPITAPIPQPQPHPNTNLSEIIFQNGVLSPGYGLGVNSEKSDTNWVIIDNAGMQMKYPGNQIWGAVFFTVGTPTNPPRPGKDLSIYNTISFDIKGELGNENVMFGIKDNLDLDNGSEVRVLIKNISNKDWTKCEYPLSVFSSATLSSLYVVAEFVFDNKPGTVYVRNIKYLYK